MAACSTCGHCPDCKTYDSECVCCPHHGGSMDDCGCRYCEDCDCIEPTTNWCPHGCSHCADCCSWIEGSDHDDYCCCSLAARAGAPAAPADNNDYLDEVFGEPVTPEELVEKWASRNGHLIKTMEGEGGHRVNGCGSGYNYVHTGKECKYGYRPDLAVVHHQHTAKDGSKWAADLLYFGWVNDKNKPADAETQVMAISTEIHKACGH